MDALRNGDFRPGEGSAAAGAATVAYVRRALALVRAGEAAAIVAAPHSETAIAAAGIAFSGYPGLVADLAGLGRDEVFLMLVGGGLRIVHATLHERLQDALARVTPELVAAAGRAAHRALAGLGVPDARIGVFGLNPHAGEDGLFGADDARVTEPAVAALRREGIRAEGPAGADVLLAARAMDAYVAVLHEQRHIPVKLLAPRGASALSIGAGVRPPHDGGAVRRQVPLGHPARRRTGRLLHGGPRLRRLPRRRHAPRRGGAAVRDHR